MERAREILGCTATIQSPAAGSATLPLMQLTCTNLIFRFQGRKGAKQRAVTVYWREKGHTHLQKEMVASEFPVSPQVSNSHPNYRSSACCKAPRHTAFCPPLARTGHQCDVLGIIAAGGLHGLQSKGPGAQNNHILQATRESRRMIDPSIRVQLASRRPVQAMGAHLPQICLPCRSGLCCPLPSPHRCACRHSTSCS